MQFIFIQIALIAIAIQQIVTLEIVKIPNDRAKGIEKVRQGSIVHCQTDTGQQCFKVLPSIDDISLTNPYHLKVSCDPNNLCVFPFDPKPENPTVSLTINCLNDQGFKDGSNITGIFGILSPNENQNPDWSKFIIRGYNTSYAKWESNVGYFNQSSGPIDTKIRAETLYTKCDPVKAFIK